MTFKFFRILKSPKEKADRGSQHSQTAICRNLAYNLEQLKLSTDNDAYMSIVDSVVIGPDTLKNTEAETCLGIWSQDFNRSLKKRDILIESGSKPSWANDGLELKQREWGEPIGGMEDDEGQESSNYKGRKRLTTVKTQNKKREREKTFIIEKDPFKWKCPDLHSQFELFSKFGDSGSTGTLPRKMDKL